MSEKELKLLATVSELLAYLDVDQEPEKFLELIASKKSISAAKVETHLITRDQPFPWQKRWH